MKMLALASAQALASRVASWSGRAAIGFLARITSSRRGILASMDPRFFCRESMDRSLTGRKISARKIYKTEEEEAQDEDVTHSPSVKASTGRRFLQLVCLQAWCASWNLGVPLLFIPSNAS